MKLRAFLAWFRIAALLLAVPLLAAGADLSPQIFEEGASASSWMGPALLALGGLPQAPALPAGAANVSSAEARLRAVRAAVEPQSFLLDLEISGEFSYSASPSGERLLLVDLPGVRSEEPSLSRLVDSPLVSSYRVVSYLRQGEPSVRLEVLLKSPTVAECRREPGKLLVVLSSKTSSRAPAAAGAAPSVKPGAAPAIPSRASAPPATGVRADRLEKITIGRRDTSTVVELVANGTVSYKAFELSNPRRLVVDIPNVMNQVGRQPLVPESPSPLRLVRAGQFQNRPPVARVVLEVSGDVKYDLRSGTNGLEVELRGSSGHGDQPPRVVATSAAPVKPVIASVAARNTEVAPAQAPPLRGAMSASADALFASVRQFMASPKVELAAAEPAPQAAEVQAPTPARPLVIPAPAGMGRAAGATVASAAAAGGAPPMQAKPAPAQQTSAAPAQQAGPRYTGEPISINVKDVDLKDFFRLIHEISGLNIILDQGVRGTVTMVLDDVPWDQALDIVLRNNGLDKQLEGNVLRIASVDTLKKEQAALAELRAAQQTATPRITVTRPVSYAKAEDLVGTVKKFLSPQADLIADSRTNMLIITDIPQGIESVDPILKELDRRTRQVEIEARIVSASREFVRELGSQFGFQTSAASRRSLFGGNPIGENSSPITTRPLNPIFTVAGGQAIPLQSNFPAAGANVGMTFAHASPNFALDLILTAAERRGIGKILSRPKIVTQNNRPGEVQQGVQIPVQTTVNNTVSVQFFDATLKLSVTPQITAENTIFLNINVQNTAIDPGIARINGVPALDTQKATTQVLVEDGGTVVFGGVIVNNNNLTVQQVPILGSIPIIGNLFKRVGVDTRTTELLFFVTPKIV